MKKVFSAIVALPILFLLSVPVFAAGNPFTDVRDGFWSTPYILNLVERGIVDGRTPTVFDPEGKITREEFAKILAVASGEDLSAYKAAAVFTDVPSKRWSASYVNWAAAKGVVDGISPTMFAPQDNITRQEMATMVNRYVKNVLGTSVPHYFAAMDFRDQRRVASWAAEAVSEMQQAGIIDGYRNVTFVPLGDATRGEAAKIIAQFLWVMEGNYVPDDPVYIFPSIDDDSASPRPQYTTFRESVNGHDVTGMLLDPATFNINVAIADYNNIMAHAAVSAIAKANGARIAVNGGYFNASTASETHGPYFTLVRSGEVMFIRNQATVFTVSADGIPAIGPLRIKLKIQQETGDGGVETTIINAGTSENYDNVVEIFTSRWGSSLGFAPSMAIAVDSHNEVVEIGEGRDMVIPDEGFVIAGGLTALGICEVGDKITWTPQYTNASDEQIRAALGAGPALVAGGQAVYDPDGEGFTSGLPKGTTARMCIGIRADGMVVLAATNARLDELSGIMLSLGCVDAMNLDGGSSSALYSGGNFLFGPGRKVNNILYFK